MVARALLVLLCLPALVFLAVELHSKQLQQDAVDVVEGGMPSADQVAHAEDLLDRAGQHNPTTEPEFTKAQLYTFTGQPGRAIELLEDIVDDEPDHLPAWILLARAADATGDAQLADRARDRATALNPRAGRLGK